jgi:hypothetical protein
MKTNLTATILFTVVSLMLVLGGTSYAQSFDNHQPLQQQTISTTVYLPIVARNWPCVPKGTTAYIATSKPVVRVGEIMTVTAAIVNECNPLVGNLLFGVFAEPSGILSPSYTQRYGFPPSIPIGGYEEVTFTLQAIGSGVVTVTTGATYETTIGCNPPGFCYNGVESSPTIVRVLPNP